MDGLIVLEPYATMIIEGRKTWELRSRKPPSSKLGKRIFLLSSGEILGVVRIASYSGPLTVNELSDHFAEHQVKEPKSGLHAWKLEVVRKFDRRRKYVHAKGARVWIKDVRPRGRREASNLSRLPNGEGSYRIQEIFRVLEETRKRFLLLEKEIGLKVPLRDIEQRWGEYFVANGLLGAGIGVTKMQSRGVDIVTGQGAVEVKTSRRTRRFRGGKVGYGWAVKREQWEGRQFAYLVCVLADEDPPKAMAFTYDELVEKFTTATFTRDNTGKREFESKRLDLINGGLKAFESNVTSSRRVLGWEGTPTQFERDFNADPRPVFERYTLERMYRLMKGAESVPPR